MKNTLCILLVTIVTSIQVFSKEKSNEEKPQVNIFNEGYFVLEGYNNSSKDTVNTTTYFKNHKTRSETTSVTFNGAGEIYRTIIFDRKTKEKLVLTDHPLDGKQYKFDKKIWSKEEIEKFEVVKGDKEKNILGYTCQQFLMKSGDQGSATEIIFEIYVTDEFNSIVSNVPDFLKNKIKGFVLSMKTSYVSDGGPNDAFWEIVKIVNKKLPDDDMFSLTPPKEYKKEGE